jgi:hypothetical protein
MFERKRSLEMKERQWDLAADAVFQPHDSAIRIEYGDPGRTKFQCVIVGNIRIFPPHIIEHFLDVQGIAVHHFADFCVGQPHQKADDAGVAFPFFRISSGLEKNGGQPVLTCPKLKWPISWPMLSKMSVRVRCGLYNIYFLPSKIKAAA